eukprot:TRINITY_DN56659_c0_g1_i1.p1 TRINITY_DN56659_c0_g1~~TRINITY_DN56659_c0_g1_i1.p1  ORF type:complete len:448 (+),score=28.07 TRINITY_DN56659_c0_g1_i1:33-1376(+)
MVSCMSEGKLPLDVLEIIADFVASFELSVCSKRLWDLLGFRFLRKHVTGHFSPTPDQVLLQHPKMSEIRALRTSTFSGLADLLLHLPQLHTLYIIESSRYLRWPRRIQQLDRAIKSLQNLTTLTFLDYRRPLSEIDIGLQQKTQLQSLTLFVKQPVVEWNSLLPPQLHTLELRFPWAVIQPEEQDGICSAVPHLRVLRMLSATHGDVPVFTLPDLHTLHISVAKTIPEAPILTASHKLRELHVEFEHQHALQSWKELLVSDKLPNLIHLSTVLQESWDATNGFLTSVTAARTTLHQLHWKVQYADPLPGVTSPAATINPPTIKQMFASLGKYNKLHTLSLLLTSSSVDTLLELLDMLPSTLEDLSLRVPRPTKFPLLQAALKPTLRRLMLFLGNCGPVHSVLNKENLLGCCPQLNLLTVFIQNCPMQLVECKKELEEASVKMQLVTY